MIYPPLRRNPDKWVHPIIRSVMWIGIAGLAWYFFTGEPDITYPGY